MNHFKVENNILQFDFEKCIYFLENKGKEHFGKHFSIAYKDKPIIYKLLVYFIMDEKSCLKYNIDPKKGILLTGPVGCGKTSLMFLMKYFSRVKIPAVKPTREIAFEFIKDGYEVINKYGKQNISYCFDDLGVEQSLKYFGNECNVMGEILLSRYDLFVKNGVRTHATTNLNAIELENMYGNRVRSRLRELFNLISFDQNTQDKRK